MHTKSLLFGLGLIFAIQLECDSTLCHKVRAGVEHDFDGTLTMFFSLRAVTFDIKSGKEVASKRLSDLFPGVKWKYPDAAYHPASDPDSIILTYRDKYYQYKNGAKIKGPSPLREIFPQNTDFSAGIDAAALFLGEEYFFKDCTMIVKQKTGQSKVYNLRDMAWPCNNDAAWVKGNRLVLAKSIFSREIDSNRRISGPICFHENFLARLPMCKCRKWGKLGKKLGAQLLGSS